MTPLYDLERAARNHPPRSRAHWFHQLAPVTIPGAESRCLGRTDRRAPRTLGEQLLDRALERNIDVTHAL